LLKSEQEREKLYMARIRWQVDTIYIWAAIATMNKKNKANPGIPNKSVHIAVLPKENMQKFQKIFYHNLLFLSWKYSLDNWFDGKNYQPIFQISVDEWCWFWFSLNWWFLQLFSHCGVKYPSIRRYYHKFGLQNYVFITSYFLPS